MNEVKDILIKAWDKPVALMTLHSDGKIYFEYTKENTINFSPIKLSDMQKTYEFSNLFFQNGVCGLVQDSLPGKYGTQYMDMFFRRNSRDIPTTLERLLFIGDNALGALSFEPSEHNTSQIEQIMDIKEFYTKSKEALSGVGPIEMSTIIALSNSAGGGARAKGIVGYNPKNQDIFLGHKHSGFVD
jgi:serine/threonine-protein kinase HipA